MEKEKFERSKPHINIGSIEQVEHVKSPLIAAIRLVYSSETYMLNRCIQQYGEELGVEYFNYLKKESRELWKDLQKIGGPEPREEQVELSKMR